MSIFAVIFQLAKNALHVHVFKNEDGDIGMGDSTGVSASLDCEIFSGGKKCQESNIGDSANTGDGGKICNTPKYTSMQRNTTSGCYFIIQAHESQ
uniref:Uncharacterized protein n=1 Tax=Tanacetum cinerariifolium TaxID=118510 RepID=A0A699I0P0_TANCI|nr:hypothetical protein [Tanacetum cinerariifolium]